MKQRLFSKLFIVFPAVLCLSILSIGNAFAADPVTVRYEVTSYQTNLDFITCHNENGPRTEIFSGDTTTWSYQFSTANRGQSVSVYPVPVHTHAGTTLVSKIFINNILYRTATGQTAATATIDDTLGNLLDTGPTQQWTIRYELTTEQTSLGMVTYSNNHTPSQSDMLAAGTRVWNYQYTTSNANQPIYIATEPVISKDTNRYYSVVMKIFVNGDMFYYNTFDPNTQPAVVNMKLNDLLTGRVQQVWPQSSGETARVEVQEFAGISPASVPNNVTASYVPANNRQPYVINFNEIMFGSPGEFRTASLSYSSGNRFVHMTFFAGPQSMETPTTPEYEMPIPPGSQLALVVPPIN
jgi:hypothetical protein